VATMARPTTVELPVEGMDCPSCAAHIETAIRKLPGVADVSVLVAAGRANVAFDPGRVSTDQIKAAIGSAGYRVPDAAPSALAGGAESAARRDVGQVIGWGVLGMVALVVVVAALGERVGLFDRALEAVPWWIPAAAVVLGGWKVFRNVVQAALRGQVISHTLMTTGAVAAAAVGQWTTAALIVFFMRFADWLEELTTGRSRQAIRQLVAMQPSTARVLRDGRETAVPVGEVAVGDVVLVRPGERVPVDGRVVEGHAPVDQAPITGESLPVDKAPGDPVFAATIAQAGFLKVEATRVGADTTLARIVRLVEEAEGQNALATFLVTGRVLNAVAVLVVACACSIALATPVVVLASVGTAARRGLLVKGGRALEQLARVDTVVMDKTGTLTRGRPQLTDVVPLNGVGEPELLRAVAAVESCSEHPLARAIVAAAAERGIDAPEPSDFVPLPGRGLTGTVDGRAWAVGNRKLLAERGVVLAPADEARAAALERAGKTAFFAAREGGLAGLVGVADVLRPEAKAALHELRALGVKRLLLLTGDSQRVAAAVAAELGLEYRAELLPEEKIAAVRALQAEGAVVMMVGDGVNDAPALAQADVGVAMGAAGTDVAIEAADVALVRDDWAMVPEAIRLGRRAAGTIRQNLAFTAVYNVVGISLAAVGVLPPVWAAAAQSLPDMAIMLNSGRLLRGPASEGRP
jgi:Cu+-exporting ATPase